MLSYVPSDPALCVSKMELCKPQPCTVLTASPQDHYPHHSCTALRLLPVLQEEQQLAASSAALPIAFPFSVTMNSQSNIPQGRKKPQRDRFWRADWGVHLDWRAGARQRRRSWLSAAVASGWIRSLQAATKSPQSAATIIPGCNPPVCDSTKSSLGNSELVERQLS